VSLPNFFTDGLAACSYRENDCHSKTACAANKGIYDCLAIMKLKRKSLVSMGSLSRMAQEATEAWKRCDFQSAIETMERISRLDPANPSLWLDLGGLYESGMIKPRRTMQRVNQE
jgi:hypothetical protein